MFATFDEIKQQVQTIIENHTHISNAYSGPVTGIYMLYIDDFSDDSVIPIYVGKTVNFKQRLKQHCRDVDTLNKTAVVDYKIGFLRGVYGMRCPYEGQYKACKIFKYMLDHKCSWADLRMVVLEVCEKEQLAEKEQFWIEELHPAYVGFNQIDSITLQWELRSQPQRHKRLALHEAELFRQYLDYGYSAFNYLHAFANNPYNPYKEELDQRAGKYIVGGLSTEEPQNLADLFGVLYENYEKEHNGARVVIEEKYASFIHDCFEKSKIKSKARENEVIDLMVNNDPCNIIRETFRTKEYLRYYMARNKASIFCGHLLDEFIRSKRDEIDILTSRVQETYQLWADHISVSLTSSRYGLIFPSVPYEGMPLGEIQ